MAQSDAELVRQCKKGDHEAFRTLFERYAQRCFSVAYGVLHNEDAAKDAIQEAFIKVFKNIQSFNESKSFYTWLYRIVVNISIDFKRKKFPSATDMSENDYASAEPDTTTNSEKSELSDRVRRVLARIPEAYRVALTLRDIEGFSCEEIAQITGVNPATVRWRIHQARKIFKSYWGENRIKVV